MLEFLLCPVDGVLLYVPSQMEARMSYSHEQIQVVALLWKASMMGAENRRRGLPEWTLYDVDWRVHLGHLCSLLWQVHISLHP